MARGETRISRKVPVRAKAVRMQDEQGPGRPGEGKFLHFPHRVADSAVVGDQVSIGRSPFHPAHDVPDARECASLSARDHLRDRHRRPAGSGERAMAGLHDRGRRIPGVSPEGVRGRAGSISAPAPAMESRPAALIRRIASSMDTSETFAMCMISLGPIEWMTSCGYAAFTAPNSDS